MTATTLPSVTTSGETILPRAAMVHGARAGLSVIVGFAPFALFIGATVAESSIDSAVGWAGSWLIFAGTAHVVAVQLLDGGATLAAVIGTAAIINVRLLVYGARMSSHWRTAPMWFKIVGAYLLVEPSFALGSTYADGDADEDDARAFYLGAAAAMWASWVALIGVGIAVGPALAPALPGHVVLLLALVAMAVPAIRDRGTRAAAAIGFVAAIATAGLPMSLGPLVAGIAGIVVGAGVESRIHQRTLEDGVGAVPGR